MINGNSVIEGEIVEANSATGTGKINILYFEGLEYDVEYTLEVEANGYLLEEGQKIIFTNRSNDYYYDDIYFTVVE